MHAKAAGVGVLSSASLTSLSVSLPYVALLRLPVGVPVVVGQRHVLQPVVLGCGWGRVGQAVGGRVRGRQAVGGRVGRVGRVGRHGAPAGAEALTGAHGARPLGQMLRVQNVPVQAAIFGPERKGRIGREERSQCESMFLLVWLMNVSTTLHL